MLDERDTSVVPNPECTLFGTLYQAWSLYCIYLCVGGADRRVKLWEVDSGACLQEYAGHNDVVRDVRVVSQQSFISAANDRYHVYTTCTFIQIRQRVQWVYP